MRVKFEYKLVPTPKGAQRPADVEGLLNRYGAGGWELVELDYGSFIFKRQFVRGPTPEGTKQT